MITLTGKAMREGLPRNRVQSCQHLLGYHPTKASHFRTSRYHYCTYLIAANKPKSRNLARGAPSRRKIPKRSSSEQHCSRKQQQETIFGPSVQPAQDVVNHITNSTSLPLAPRTNPDRDLQEKKPSLRIHPTGKITQKSPPEHFNSRIRPTSRTPSGRSPLSKVKTLPPFDLPSPATNPIESHLSKPHLSPENEDKAPDKISSV